MRKIKKKTKKRKTFKIVEDKVVVEREGVIQLLQLKKLCELTGVEPTTNEVKELFKKLDGLELTTGIEKEFKSIEALHSLNNLMDSLQIPTI